MTIQRSEEVILIAVTGGPCAGKTTGLAVAQQWLSDLGYIAIIVPEAATDFIKCGLSPKENWWQPNSFNEHLLEYIVSREDLFTQAARDIDSDKPRVLLCDRGVLDAIAYTGKEAFADIMHSVGVTLIELRDRYKSVIHLVTAANGAETFYSLENNSARTETIVEAQELDIRTQQAWVGSQHLAVIDNSTDFQGKIARFKQAIAGILGIPVPLEIEKKFLLPRWMNLDALPAHAERVSILQHYLASDSNTECRVRRRERDGSATYFSTEKRTLRPGIREEKEQQITKREYLRLLKSQDPRCNPISKDRYTFLHKNQYFELDVFRGALKGLVLLEIELTEENQLVSLPDFLSKAKDVTGDQQYSNATLARE